MMLKWIRGSGSIEESGMNAHRWFPTLIVLAIVSAACGNSDDEAAVYSPEELGTALLTADDVGSGWIQRDKQVFEIRPDGLGALDPGMWCPAAADVPDQLLTFVAGGGAFVNLQSGESTGGAAGRGFHGVSEQLWSSSDAEAFVDEVAGGFQTCIGETWVLDEEATASVEALAGDDVGDDSTMAVVTYVTPAPDGDYAWRGRTLVARFGATVMMLQELDVQRVDLEPHFTDADWQHIVDTAVGGIDTLTDR
jgi:hypothetical protein